jgi:UV DNA damage endonuclease
MDRDAVMILHMGGVFGDKQATIDRFRENYKKLSKDIKRRLVLENDDVGWTVHDLLPVCEELNIPLVLDFHHHNIMFDAEKLREGTLDIMSLYDRISATWARKGITQKMHYSEPVPGAITARDRRKHRPRVQMLPPCDPTMDLMIEAKDKEQAVFELMRTYKLPGYEKINDMIPYTRDDEAKRLSKGTANGPTMAPEEEGMGGQEGRVYWPPGLEDWLRPEKGSRKRKTAADAVAIDEAEPAVETKSPRKGRKRLEGPVFADAEDLGAPSPQEPPVEEAVGARRTRSSARRRRVVSYTEQDSA